jgi:thiol-disulfide isomerase/thioredoxin
MTTPDNPVTAAPPATPPATTPQNEAPKNESKDQLAQIKELQGKQQQLRSRNEASDHFAKQLDLSEKVLAANPEAADRDHARDAAFQAITFISQFDPKRRELLEKVDKLADATLADTPDGPTASTALFFKTLVHLNIERDGSESDPSINKKLFEMAKEFAAKAPNDPRTGQLLYMIGDNAMSDSQNETALEIFKHLVEVDAQGQFGQMATSKLALLEAIGKPPAIAGPTLDGSEIDIASLKGKVVLVDFWATWCGPCIAELPNVQAVYDKYHAEGFEVIAISFDRTKDALTKYVEEKKLPWPQIFFDEEGKRFWQNPLGQRYGINSIPATFLVDREGNLQKIGVRGAALEPAVVEMLKGAKPPLAN